MAKIDIARALKDRAYFDSLSEADKNMVRSSNPVGSSLSDDQLETVSGGLEGGSDGLASTTTTTKLEQCSCRSAVPPVEQPQEPGGCTCAC